MHSTLSRKDRPNARAKKSLYNEEKISTVKKTNSKRMVSIKAKQVSK